MTLSVGDSSESTGDPPTTNPTMTDPDPDTDTGTPDTSTSSSTNTTTSTGSDTTSSSSTDEGSSSSGSDSTSSSESSSSESSSSESSTSDSSSSDSSSSESSSSTTTDGSTSTTDGTTTTDGGSTTTDDGSSTDDGTTTGGVIDACDEIPTGPFAPTMAGNTPIYDGSEDLAFDGLGNLAAQRDDEILLVQADLSSTVLTDSLPDVFGTRYRGDGDLVLADFDGDELVLVSPGGVVTPWIADIDGPNGVYPDFFANVWVTEMNGDRVLRIDDTGTLHEVVVGTDAESANGIVFDDARDLLFWTNWSEGTIRSVAIDAAFDPVGMPALVGTIPGGGPDGLALDVCGNLYVVDQANDELWRFELDDAGAELDSSSIAEFTTGVSNAQFGSGAGFATTSLYVTGNPGTVWVVDLQVPGAAVPTAP
jgi:hypothetical protein